MKTVFKLFALLAAVLTLAACEKDKEVTRHGRDIVYTVDAQTHTVHLATEAEWDALLEKFCDWAEDGKTVSFYNASRATKGVTKESVSYSTTSRQEMKDWMRRMEDEGKTVTVTYDSRTGTWNGTAYATAPPQYGCFTGKLIFLPTPIMHSGVNEPAIVAALQINADSTLFLTYNGEFGEGLVDSIGSEYSEGDTVTLCGTLLNVVDYNGNAFLALELNDGVGPIPDPVPNPNGELLTYECDMMPAFSYIISFDTTNHRVYISLHDSTYMPNVPIGSGLPLGIYEYSPSGTTNAYMLTDGMGETSGPYLFQFAGGFGGNTLTFNTSDMSHPVTLVRTHKWSTYICLDMNLDFVMHTAKDSLWNLYSVILGQLASNIVPRVNCQTPFLYGRFQMTSPQWYGGNNPFDMEIYQPVNDTEGYWINTLSIEGEPTVDHHFTIKVDWPYESTYCTDTYNFYRP